MKSRILRRILFASLALVMLGVGGGAWLLTRSNALEQALLGQISNSLLTRGHITEIELSLWDDFPLVSLSMNDVWLAGSGEGGAGAGPFSGDTLLRAKRLGLTLDAMSLLGDEPRIEALNVWGATLVLAQRSDGEWNTDVWKTGDPEGAFAFQIDRLRLEDVRIQIGDLGATIDESTCRGTYGDDALEATVDATLRAFEQPIELHFNASQRGDDWECSQLTVQALGATATGSFALRGDQPQLELNLKSLEAQRLARFLGVEMDANVTVDAALNGTLAWDGSAWTGHAKPDHGRLHLSEGLHPWWDEAPSADWDGAWAGTVWFLYSDLDWRVDIPQLELTLPGFAATTEVTWTPRKLELKGSLEATPAVAERCPSIPDVQWNSGALNSDFAVTWNGAHFDYALNANLSRANGTWGKNPWSAQAETRILPDRLDVLGAELNWATEQWNLSGTLYDPWSGGPFIGHFEASAPRLTMTEGAPTETLPWWEALELPPGSQLTAEVDIAEIAYGGVHLTGNQAALTCSPQRIEFAASAEAWNGTCSARGSATWNADGARMEADYIAEDLSVHHLFNEFGDFGQTTLRSEHFSGLLDSDGTAVLEWNADGTWAWDRIRWAGNQTLNEGRLVGVESLMSIPDYLSDHRMAAPLINPSDLRAKLVEIELHTVSTPAYFFDNAFHIPQCSIQSESLNVSVEGSQSLSGYIDYSIGIELRELRNKKANDIGMIEDDGLGNHLFINIIGDVEAPEFRWDRESQRAHRRKDFQAERDRLKALWNKSPPN
jgi:hypothetical protein